MAETIVTTSWDDGHVLDLKLAGLLSEYDLPGTFYVAPDNREIALRERMTATQIRDLSRQFEIGAHTLTHPVLTTIPDDEAQREIVGSKQKLEQIVGRPIATFCYPRGAYNQTHVRIIRDAGFRYARTVRRFAQQSGRPLEAGTTIHAYRHLTDLIPILRIAGYNPLQTLRYLMNWDELAIELFNQALATGGTFHIWGHSWEIDKNRDWTRLERVFKHIRARSNVRYVSNGELL